MLAEKIGPPNVPDSIHFPSDRLDSLTKMADWVRGRLEDERKELDAYIQGFFDKRDALRDQVLDIQKECASHSLLVANARQIVDTEEYVKNLARGKVLLQNAINEEEKARNEGTRMPRPSAHELLIALGTTAVFLSDKLKDNGKDAGSKANTYESQSVNSTPRRSIRRSEVSNPFNSADFLNPRMSQSVNSTPRRSIRGKSPGSPII